MLLVLTLVQCEAPRYHFKVVKHGMCYGIHLQYSRPNLDRVLAACVCSTVDIAVDTYNFRGCVGFCIIGMSS
jgi:hypothetical protein